MRTFNHYGALGDIIYSLPVIISYGGGCLYVTKSNQYNFLRTLLEKQTYLKEIRTGKDYKKNPSTINLDMYRSFALENRHVNLASIYLEIFNKKYDLSKPWLKNISPKYVNKIIINRSKKYHNKPNSIDYQVLKKYEGIITFIGFNKDRIAFEEKYNIKTDFYHVSDALEMAQIIKGSKLYIGNQSLPYALAEGLKHPRVLEEYEYFKNCTPMSPNGHTVLTSDVIDKYLNTKTNLPTVIPESEINKSSVLQTIFTESDKPTVFLPNYGEFGSTVHKLIRLVEFHKSPKKIVCCKKGEEAFFPSADEFFYDWDDCVEDVHKWGFFSKRQVQGGNPMYGEYKNMVAADFEKIKSVFGDGCNYVHLWKYNKDSCFQNHAHHFRINLKPKIVQNIQADIIISPRNRKGRSENNFLKWDELINFFSRNGYSVGCVGSKEQSLKLKGSHINSWDCEDNSSAVIELLNNCQLYLGLDTGVSHLASIMSVPMIVFSHSNQKHYLTSFMKQATTDYFLDLGKNVQSANTITDSVMKFFGDK